MQELDSAADKLDKSIDSAGKSADDASMVVLQSLKEH